MPFSVPGILANLKKTFRYKKVFLYFGLALLIVDVLSLSYFRILDRFELVTLDFRHSVRLLFPQKINPDIAIIEIGEDSLGFLGKWPLPRDYHASLIDVLRKSGARMIIFDILFCEPTDWDSVLAASAKKAGNVYFPFAFRLKERPVGGMFEAVNIDAPLIEDFKAASKGEGFINKVVDRDGKVRHIPLFARFGKNIYPSLAFEAACDYLEAGTAVSHFKNSRVSLKGSYVPLNEDGSVLINFAGRWESTFRHYSYLDVLVAQQELSEGKAPRVDLNSLKGKVCFVALTATGTQEIGAIPIQNNYPMVGVHANLFNMLTQGAYLSRLGRIGNLIILILLSLVIVMLIRRFKPYKAFFISIGIISLLFISAVLLFVFKGVWIDIACPALTLFGLYVSVTLSKYIGEVRAREKIQKELAVASSIQRCFLPEEVPSMAGLDIAASMKTAKEVGGDLYDFIKLGDTRLGVMIGDVSGKGIPAALFMAKVETLFKVYARSEGQPSRTLEMLNNEVARDERSGLFTTLAYAIFDVKLKTLFFSDAGHLPLLLIRGGDSEKLSMDDGMAIGVMDGINFSDRTVKLSTGDIVVFYTDGVSEARNIKGKELGVDRLIALVSQSRGLPAKGIIDLILDELRVFQGKALQHDDITVIVVKIC